MQQSEAFVVRMSADPHRVGGIGVERVVDQPQLARRLGDEALEEVGRFAERLGKSAEQPAAEREGRVVVSRDAGAKTRQIGPLIGTEQRIAGAIVRVVRRQIEGQVVGFLLVLATGVEDFLAFRHIAAMVARTADIDRHLALDRLGEEPFGRHQQPVDQRLRDTVTRHIDEADLARHPAQFTGNAGARRPVGSCQSGHVDGGNG